MAANAQKHRLLILTFVLIWPLLILFTYIPPFSLLMPSFLFDLYFDFSLGGLPIQKLLLEDASFLIYRMLIAGTLLNLGMRCIYLKSRDFRRYSLPL